MEMKDFFISYNKTNKDWAKWIAGTLEERGYSVYLQAWDISPGDDFIARMNEFLEYSKNYIAIYTSDFVASEYCMKEFQTAFNASLIKKIDKFIPIRLEDIDLGPLYSTTVYIDLFDLTEEEAMKKLLNGLGDTINPRNKGKYPRGNGKKENKNNNIFFPKFIKNEEINYRDILILEKDKNKKGDIFNQLVFNVFHALGFDEYQYNIQKIGREIDMVLKHRTENRMAFVECKAHKEPIGGDDVNKFIGVIDLERKRCEAEGIETVGYFVSKSGFKASAIEQEKERSQYNGRENKLVLLGTKDIIRELVSGNMICSLEKAVSTVNKDGNLYLCKDVDLIACEYGWIWVLYYSSKPSQLATHFTFVHADGNPLLNHIANNILKIEEYSKHFSNLTYINTPESKKLDLSASKNAYFKYLENELGVIQFEGMPTDKEAGAVKVQLENIFVPLGFYKKEDDKYKKHTIKDVLNSQKSAILAKPGGGKSTLIRRIALAYAYPDRRKKVRDGLPDKELFPIYIRCRDLGEDANNSILEIISLIVKRAEIRQYEEAFNALVEDYLQNGQALLLIDGLDEIANERTRISFVNQLRTFLAIYPATRLLITSREAGFRAVAETLAGHCEQYSIANFQEKEIRELSLKWHNAVLGEGGDAKDESKKVCDIIIADNRIMSLAENPLLLTTLLFVKRWVGYLPTKKCQLYEEMIKLLLVTWNAIAHEKLDMDETEPQLAYIAYCMTSQGKQKITKGELAKCVIEARKALPELLGYTALSPANFIAQVEERSSLLIQLGLEENENGKLVPSYEFSHLSFQEYLTAKAVAEEWLPKDSASGLDIIKEHLSDEHWKEVIPIITVLLGRKAKPIIEFLLEECRSFEDQFNKGLATKKDFERNRAPFHLANCIASEVPISVDMLEESFNFIIKGKRNIDYVIRQHLDYTYDNGSVYNVILKSKYGEKYKDLVERKLSYSIDKNYFYEYCDAWLSINAYAYKNVKDIVKYFITESQIDYIKGALLTMNYAYYYRHRKNDSKHTVNIIDDADKNLIFEGIYNLLNTNEELSLFAATWSIAWSGYNESDIISDDFYPLIFEKLIKLWMSDIDCSELSRTISWSLLSIVRPNLCYGKIVGQDLYECIERKFNEPQNEFDVEVTISLAYLTGYWSANEVVNKFRLSQKNLFRHGEPSRFWQEISLTNKTIAEELNRLENKRYGRA